jgi:hypothetical protein
MQPAEVQVGSLMNGTGEPGCRSAERYAGTIHTWIDVHIEMKGYALPRRLCIDQTDDLQVVREGGEGDLWMCAGKGDGVFNIRANERVSQHDITSASPHDHVYLCQSGGFGLGDARLELQFEDLRTLVSFDMRAQARQITDMSLHACNIVLHASAVDEQRWAWDLRCQLGSGKER